MEHISDIEMQEYVSGRLPEAKVEKVRRHLDECGDCAKRYQDSVGVWDALGQWRVDCSGHEIANRIEAFAVERNTNQRKSVTKKIPFTNSFKAVLRVAAAILISIAGGHLLGRYSVSQRSNEIQVSQEKPRYIAALGFEWSSELTWTALEEEATPDEVN
jgi:anti-sigma factor RsiW